MQKNTFLTSFLLGLFIVTVPCQLQAGRWVYYPTPVVVTRPIVIHREPTMFNEIAAVISLASLGYSCFQFARAFTYWATPNGNDPEQEEYNKQEQSESIDKGICGLGVSLVSSALASTRSSYNFLENMFYASYIYSVWHNIFSRRY